MYRKVAIEGYNKTGVTDIDVRKAGKLGTAWSKERRNRRLT